MFYKSDEITGGKSYVSDYEKTKLTLKIKQALKNKKINEIIVIEGNSDTIKFIKDKKIEKIFLLLSKEQ